MSLKNRIHDELNRLGPLVAGGARHTLIMDVDGGQLCCALTAIDQLACAFEEFTFRAPRLENATLPQLDRIAATLARQLSYLLESISPVERDKDGCVVQMRSSPPQKDDDGTSYYELVVRRGELALSRYSKVSGQARRTIAANVTREVFCRLATDFSAVAAQELV
jgi:hypothetical protein